QNDVTLKMPAFEWVHVQLHQQKGMISLSPPTICNSAALSKGLPFRAATDGESVSGKFTGTVHLSSGKFAVVEKSHEFTLVPWRPIIDRQLGREVMGIVQGGSVSWQLGRQRGLER
ncbi:DUF3363 domain-containing protein, partial [Escherichia coli]